MLQSLFGEKSLTKVVAFYATQDAAERAAARLRERRPGGMQITQVKLLRPEDAKRSRREILSTKEEPDQAGIWQTILRTHARLGLLGFIVGVLIWYGFRAAGNAAVLLSPLLSFIAIVLFSTMMGGMLAGLLSLRPDQTTMVQAIRDALREGRWAVMAHPTTPEQTEAAMRGLREGSTSDVLRTL